MAVFPRFNTLLFQQPVQRGSAECRAQIRVAVVDSETWVADFRQVAPLCVMNLMELELTDVFRTKRRRRVPKIVCIFVQAF